MQNMQFSRTVSLIGQEGVNTLQNCRVAVVGLGGVGGHCAEALARAGAGALLLIDADVVEQSNLNRQIIATRHTVGMDKATLMKSRIQDICDCKVSVEKEFLLSGNAERLLSGKLDFVVDAVDTVAAKLAIIAFCKQNNIPCISCMGTGNRLDPSKLFIQDIYETRGCPLARAVRKGCRELGIEELPVVISAEEPMTDAKTAPSRTPASAPFVPGAAGLLLASYVTRRLIKQIL